jgi:ribosomal protein L44E
MLGGEDMKEQKINTGERRRKRETKSRGFYMRMSPSELSDLDILSYACEESKTEIMRKALRVYYDLHKNKL